MSHIAIPQSKLLDISGYQLWDLAGIDGLQFAKALFGEASGKIAPFQSFESSLNGCFCSVLRLCERNFRIGLQGEATVFEQASVQLQANYKIWVKRCEWMRAIAVPEALLLNLLPQIAISKAPHRLEGLQCNCAVPARINGISVLIWRHQLLGQPAFELHTAVKDVEAVQAKVMI